jgi:transcriptional regulator with XRE-family HTH domain
MYSEYFCQTVTKRLKDNKISLAELAKRTGVTRAHLFNVIHGKSNPTLEMMTLISVHLEVPLSVLLDDPEYRQLGCADGYEYTTNLQLSSEASDSDSVKQDEPSKTKNSAKKERASDVSSSAISTLIQNDLVILQNLHEIRQLLVKKPPK